MAHGCSRAVRHLDHPALMPSRTATITTTASTAFDPVFPIRLATSAPRKYEIPTYIAVKKEPEASAPSMKTGNRTRKIPDIYAGMVTDAAKS